SWSQRKRLASIGAPCAVKPDVDNFAKQVADALEGVAYPNDSRITDVVTRKRYGSTASLIIEVGPAS
ncbi:MAG: RusA family crossover junction endodeoxyribonuclease, partial [Pseudomonadota bacterium]